MDGDLDTDVMVMGELNPQFFLDQRKLMQITNSLASAIGLEDYSIALSVADPHKMAELNQQYRNKAGSTDVLSFPQLIFNRPVIFGEAVSHIEEDGFLAEKHLGDIVICLENAWANASEIGHGLDREVLFLIIHGLLHLCGHDHQYPEKEEVMVGEQNKLLEIMMSDGETGLV